MGINYMFKWLYKFDASCISNVNISNDINIGQEVDNLYIDFNGMIHYSAQQVYNYGQQNKYTSSYNYVNATTEQMVFKNVFERLLEIFYLIKPTKNVYIMTDGIAPLCKMNQQRQRRFKQSDTKKNEDLSISKILLKIDNNLSDPKIFNPHCISPGTSFMNSISIYLHDAILKEMSTNPFLANLKITFSNDKVVGEGEYKIFKNIRLQKKKEVNVIYGSDADIIMQSVLSSTKSSIYILRDELYNRTVKFLLVDVDNFKAKLLNTLYVDHPLYDKYSSLRDFVTYCFMLGNDFLPNINVLSILEDGIECMISCWRKNLIENGHIVDNSYKINKKSMKNFLVLVKEYETSVINNKLSKSIYHVDNIMLKSSNIVDTKHEIDIEQYNKNYNKEFFGKNIENFALHYLDGLEYVIQYYGLEMRSNMWAYNHHYSPTLSSIIDNIDKFVSKKIEKFVEISNYEQLLYILPKSSYNLLPKPFHDIETPNTVINSVEMDLSGRKYIYQGVLLLPFDDIKIFQKIFNDNKDKMNYDDIKRNMHGKDMVYKYSESKVSMNFV